MKKLILCVICFMLFASAGFSSNVTPVGEASSELVVGNTTRMSGSFFSESWGNNTADIDVRNLLHDYPTIAWTSNGDYVLNKTVVKRVLTREGTNSITRYISLHEDLFFSDGSPVTAKDYVFSVLLFSSPVISKLGGIAADYSHLKGYAQYASGENKSFSGVILVDDFTFALRTDKVTLPYYYDDALLNVMPYPIKVIAPGCEVRDDGEGAYIEGDFSAELLTATILDPSKGYRSHPSVVSGPYQLTDYDDVEGIATFRLNSYYKGNYNGQKPSIPSLIYRQVFNDTMLDELQNGTVGLINKATSGEVITNALDLENEGILQAVDYPRTGLSFLAFTCEQGSTQSVLIRQAVARILNRDEITQKFLFGFGEPVYGYYGLGQWMAKERADQLESLNLYPFSLTEAAVLIEQDGWALNRQGGVYDPKVNTLRYKDIDGRFEPLILSVAIPERNPAAVILMEMMKENFAKVGGLIEGVEIPMDELLHRYYRQEDRGYDMFFLGSNFSYLFDPYPTYHTGDEFQGAANTSGLKDERLMELTERLRQTPPGNRTVYLIRWMNFQKYWVSVLPLVPIYSNTYYDLFTPNLQGYRPDKYYSWATAILYASITDE